MRLSFAELREQAVAFADRLVTAGLTGERVLVLLPQGAAYVVSFLGCLYAGAVPVPVFPPAGKRAERVERIAADCTPRLAVVGPGRAAGTELPGSCDVWELDDTPLPAADAPTLPALAPSDCAYLQYTSGSTGSPRGVMVTHGNIVHQLRLMAAPLRLTPEDTSVSWLPLFHDLGMIGGLLYPLSAGATVVIMSPLSFVQRPLRWLAAITRYGAAITYTPNFALELCCDRIGPEDRAGLDLSTLRAVPIGAEPVRADSLARFVETFGGCGADLRSFNPGYGMAEATLTLTFCPVGEPITIARFDPVALTHGRLVPAGPDGGRSRELVGNGPAWLDTEVVVVDPDTGARRPDGAEGEIWVAGRTVAAGYWGRPEETAATFGATAPDGTGPYLRTGDLGAWHDGGLYVTGRRKDLIIVRGGNFYPHDLERTTAASHPALAPDRAIAMSVTVEGTERVVLVQELVRARRGSVDPDEVFAAVRRAIGEEYELDVEDIVLLRPGRLPMTSSGKVRRQECKRLYTTGELVAEHRLAAPPEPVHAAPAPAPGRGRQQIADWLADRIAALTSTPRERVDVAAPFGSFGASSVTLVGLSGELQSWLGRRVDPTWLYDHPSIERLARALAGDAPEPATAPVPAAPATRSPDADRPAVVGMACSVPGAPSVEDFWHLLLGGRDAITEVPESRWSADRYFRAGEPTPGRTTTRWGGFVEGIDEFDAEFFGISRAEAESMDPQQRLLLTTTWRAFEDAGVDVDALAGTRAGVFVGISTTDYRQLQARDRAGTDAYSGTGTAPSVAANRISYFFDLRGPSLAVDTACSSSLVALHQAAASLSSGECDLAVVAGVNALLDPALTVVFSQAGMMAADGRCKTFDAAADGYVRGEGCAVLVLRRLSDARADGDRVRAVVAGSAVGQDGQSSSLTAPNGLAQQEVLRGALAAAGVPAGDVGYLEAHGTGTRLGDPIEMAAVRAVYGAGDEPLRIGSVKTNIGHLEAAAGVAGVVKAVLALEHGTVPPHRNLTTLNPLIDLAGTRLRIPVTEESWPAGPRPRAAAVSSFGFGGTNAHVVLTEAPAGSGPDRRPAGVTGGEPALQLLPVSARSAAALAGLARGYADRLDAGDVALPAVAHTAGARRPHRGHRLAVVARTSQDAAALLRRHLDGDEPAEVLTGVVGRPRFGPVAFLFTGQGAQRAGMAAAPYFRHAAFRAALDECDAVVRAELGASLLPTLCGLPGEQVDLDLTLWAQPAVFAVDYAFARLWQAAGVHPDLVLGHSLGEYVAACVAGVHTLADALLLVTLRARAMQDHAAAGAMYALHGEPDLVAAAQAEVAGSGAPGVSLGAVNGPEDVVVSGDEAAAAALAARWEGRGLRVTRLAGTRAFHSPLMRDAVAEFERAAASVGYAPAQLPLVSNLTGAVLAPDGISPAYWARHALAPVRFGAGLAALAAAGCDVAVECGPHPVLTALSAAALPAALCVPSLHRADTDDTRFLLGVGQWYVRGGEVDWTGLLRGREGAQARPPCPVPLPGHPFAAERYWYAGGVADEPDRPSAHPLLGDEVAQAGTDQRRFTGVLSDRRPSYLAQHVVLGAAVLPAAATIEAALAAARLTGPADATGWALRDVTFDHVVRLAGAEPVPVQTTVEPGPTGMLVRCFARPGGSPGWLPYASATGAADRTAPDGPVDLDRLRGELAEQDVAGLYGDLSAVGLDYGPDFRGLRRLWRTGDRALARIEPADGPDRAGYVLHPVVLDACLHVVSAFADGVTLFPVGVDHLTVHAPLPARVWSLARWHGPLPGGELRVDLDLLSDAGELVARLDGLRLREPVPAPAEPSAYDVGWEAAPEPAAAPAGSGRWLVVGAAVDVAGWVEALGSRAVTLTTDAGAGERVVDPTSDADTARAVGVVRAAVDGLAGIVLLPDGDQPDPPGADGSTADDVPDRAYRTARRSGTLLKHLLGTFGASRPTVVVCTAGAVRLPTETALPDLAGSVSTGLARTVAAEYPDLDCVQVDLDRTVPPPADVLGRVAALDGSGHLVVRGDRWYAARLREVPLPVGGRTPIRGDGTYLVTGGLGALGLAVAGRLADRGAGTLLLVGRTVPAGAPAAVEALRRRGTRVEVRQVDVADPDAVAALVAAAGRDQPPLRGVVHAAGTAADAPLTDADWSTWRGVLDPKVRGGWHLHRATRTLDLDFFVLYSSMASMVGSAGQASYAAANAFLDALADHRRRSGLAGLSVAWGPWAEIGMAARPQLLDRLAATGVGALSTEAALAAADRLFDADTARVGVADMDWPRFAAGRGRPDTLLAGVTGPGPTPPAVPALDVDVLARMVLREPAAAREQVLGELLDRVAPMLGLSRVQRDALRPTFGGTRLNELGMDSLMAVRLRNRLLADLGADIPPQFLFGGSTVSDLVERVCEQLTVRSLVGPPDLAGAAGEEMEVLTF